VNLFPSESGGSDGDFDQVAIANLNSRIKVGLFIGKRLIKFEGGINKKKGVFQQRVPYSSPQLFLESSFANLTKRIINTLC
jgi:hypothetical protein